MGEPVGDAADSGGGSARSLGMLDALAIMLLSFAAAILVIWIAGVEIGTPPEWLRDAISSVWSWIIGSAAAAAAIGRWLRSGRSAGYYLTGTLLGTVTLLLVVFGATRLFPDESSQPDTDAFGLFFRLQAAPELHDLIQLTYTQQAPRFLPPRNIATQADGAFRADIKEITRGASFVAKARQRVTESRRSSGVDAPIEMCLVHDTAVDGPKEVFLLCPLEGQCVKDPARDHGWMSGCGAGLGGRWPSLIPKAFAMQSGAVRWLVPSLATLEATADERRSGYTRFSITSATDFPAATGADAYQLELYVNDVPILIDGWQADEILYPLKPGVPFETAFGLQNLDFSGKHAGYEMLRAEIHLLRDGKRLDGGPLTLTRTYVALRPAEPSELVVGGYRFQWSGRYVRPLNEDKFEVFLRSERNDELAVAAKTRIDEAGWEYDGQSVTAVIRPPLGSNPFRGLAVGLIQPTGQVDFTFNRRQADDLCQWVNRQRSQSGSLIDRQAYRYEMRPLDKPVSERVEFCSIERQVAYAASQQGPNVAVYTNLVSEPKWCLALPHENESTAFRIAKAFVAAHGGSLVRVEQAGGRNISFDGPQRSWLVDPNRMFSDEGVRKSLNLLNGDAGASPGPIVDLVGQFANAYLAALEHCLTTASTSLVVALHNNRDNAGEPDGFSVLSYRDSPGVKIHDGKDVDNFFIATSEFDFQRLQGNWNAVWMRGQQDDFGSLSERYAQSRYINVEAQHGNAAVQTRMLEALVDLLDD